MKTKAEIKINFMQARNKANELDQLANKLEKMANNSFAGTMQDISRNWKGQSANDYLRKGALLQSKMSGTAQELRRVADEIRTTATRWYEAEMRAVAIAETIGGGGGFR